MKIPFSILHRVVACYNPNFFKTKCNELLKHLRKIVFHTKTYASIMMSLYCSKNAKF